MATLVPSSDQLINPLIETLRSLGGSGTYAEIACGVIDRVKLDAKQQAKLHNHPRFQCSEFEYRLDRALELLAFSLIVEPCSLGVWALTEAAKNYEHVNPAEIRRMLTEAGVRSSVTEGERPTWQHIVQTCIKDMSADGFEMTMLRVLRENGFHQITVTERTAEAVAGKGLVRLDGLISFRVSFRCLRGSSLVDAAEVRALRQSMQEPGDRAVLISTASYSREAMREAYQDGLAPVDLIDGHELANILRDLELGIMTHASSVEHIDVDEEYFGML